MAVVREVTGQVNIVHVAAHMGAGAGKAISGLALSDRINTHKIILCQKPDKMEHINRCEDKGINVLICPERVRLMTELAAADVIVINWWHHPVVYEVMLAIEKLDARIVLWSHVNGLYYPELNESFLSVFDACMFTSKAVFENEHWTEPVKEILRKKSALVYGMGDFNPESFPAKVDYSVWEMITVGYVGSLDYAKLHPDFVRWAGKVVKKDPRIRFKIAGDIKPEVVQDVKEQEVSDKMKFLGFQKDVPNLLKMFDLFVYPLNPYNFATTENAILEAMAVGLPVIACSGIVERAIIRHGVNGILVSDGEEFVAELIQLADSEEDRSRIGRKAREDTIQTYDVEDNLLRFYKVMEMAMDRPKSMHLFSKVIGEEPFQWFLSGCGEEERKLFRKMLSVDEKAEADREWPNSFNTLQQVYIGQSKGSVIQYYHLYPENKLLEKLAKMIEKQRRMENEGKDRNEVS